MKLASELNNFAATCHKSRFYKNFTNKLSVFFLFLLMGLLNNAHAKDLTGRLGFGISNMGPQTMEGFSVDWNLTNASSFEANFGLSGSEVQGGWDLGFRASRNLFIEDHLISSIFVGAALVKEKINSESTLGYVVETGFGTKFFFQEFPNLGFGAKAALQMLKLNELQFQISPVFSLHYYF